MPAAVAGVTRSDELNPAEVIPGKVHRASLTTVASVSRKIAEDQARSIELESCCPRIKPTRLRHFANPMPKKEPPRQFKVGDKIRANLHRGKIDEAVVKAIIDTDEGQKLQVDIVGVDVTALIDPAASPGRLKRVRTHVGRYSLSRSRTWKRYFQAEVSRSMVPRTNGITVNSATLAGETR